MPAGRESTLRNVPFSGGARARKTVIEARDIIHVYGQGAGRRRVLQGISFALKAGELTLLMGPSGSGKTTVLSILGCILTPTRGTVYIAGEPVTRMSAEQLSLFRRRHIGYVFQSYHLFPTLTAEENIRIALDVRDVKRSDAVVAAQRALQTVGLLHKARSFPSNLSGGEQQRVAVARALVARPSVILADEPTASLDGKNGMAVMELLKQLAVEPSRAVLAVTHDPRTVPFADRVLHIEDGLIVSERQRPEGILTVNDFALARNQTIKERSALPLKFPTINPEREHHLETIWAILHKYAPDCEPPFTLSDIMKARFAQRRQDGATRTCTAREDVLLIVADWDNPDDALASQSDECLGSLADTFVNVRPSLERIPTAHEFSVLRNRRMAIKERNSLPPKLSTFNPERERHLETIWAILHKYAPDCEPPFTLSDIMKARFAQRRQDGSPHTCTAREDVLLIVADWDNPDDALASQNDDCLAILADMFRR